MANKATISERTIESQNERIDRSIDRWKNATFLRKSTADFISFYFCGGTVIDYIT